MQKLSALFLMSIIVASYSHSMEKPESNNQDIDTFTYEGNQSDKDFCEKYATTMEEMHDVWLDAPVLAKNVLRRILKPHIFPNGWRSKFFIGKPGVGKTTLAKAIAYKALKADGWNCVFFTATEFSSVGDARNYTGDRLIGTLRHISDYAKKNGIKTIVIIDEINELLENFTSQHHDTGHTAIALWTFLDKQMHNHNFYLIGTLNDGDKIPPQIKDRTKSRYVELIGSRDLDDKKKSFLKKMNTPISQLDNQVSDELINRYLVRTEEWNPRDFTELANAAIEFVRGEGNESPIAVIKKIHLDQAFNLFKRGNELFDYNKKEETEAERHFQEQQRTQREFHEESIQLQRESIQLQKTQHTMQDWQFKESQKNQAIQSLYQHRIQLIVSKNQIGGRLSDEGYREAESMLFTQQLGGYDTTKLDDIINRAQSLRASLLASIDIASDLLSEIKKEQEANHKLLWWG